MRRRRIQLHCAINFWTFKRISSSFDDHLGPIQQNLKTNKIFVIFLLNSNTFEFPLLFLLVICTALNCKARPWNTIEKCSCVARDGFWRALWRGKTNFVHYKYASNFGASCSALHINTGQKGGEITRSTPPPSGTSGL